MGGRLSSIDKKILLDNEIVFADYATSVISIGQCDGGYALQFIYSEGVSVDMSLILEGSIDGRNFSTISTTPINTSSGNELWEVVSTALEFIRFRVIVNSGTVKATLLYNAKGRH